MTTKTKIININSDFCSIFNKDVGLEVNVIDYLSNRSYQSDRKLYNDVSSLLIEKMVYNLYYDVDIILMQELDESLLQVPIIRD